MQNIVISYSPLCPYFLCVIVIKVADICRTLNTSMMKAEPTILFYNIDIYPILNQSQKVELTLGQ